MKKITLIIALLLASVRPAFAQTASVSATPSPETINRIQEAINKNLKNAETVLSETSNRLVGYAGIVSDIKEGVISLESGSLSIQVSLTPTTAILKDGKSIKPEQISLNDKALIIGNLTAPEVITAKRIVISTKEEKKVEKRIVFSPILKINATTLTLKIDDKNTNLTLGKKLKLNLKELNLGQKVFGVVQLGTDGTGILIQAKVI